VRKLLTYLLFVCSINSYAQTTEYSVYKKAKYIGEPWILELRVYHENLLDEIPDLYKLPDSNNDWTELKLLPFKKKNMNEYYVIQRIQAIPRMREGSANLPAIKFSVMLKGEKKFNPLLGSSINSKPTSKVIETLDKTIDIKLRNVINPIFGDMNILASKDIIAKDGIINYQVKFKGDLALNVLKQPRLNLTNLNVISVNSQIDESTLTFNYKLSLMDKTKDGLIVTPEYFFTNKGEYSLTSPTYVFNLNNSKIPGSLEQKEIRIKNREELLACVLWLLLVFLLISFIRYFRKSIHYFLKNMLKKTEAYLLQLIVTLGYNPISLVKAKINKFETGDYTDVMKYFLTSYYGQNGKLSKSDWRELINSLYG
jgi:hypothetical protein